MKTKRQTIGLIVFLKGSPDPKVGMPGCANYDHHYGGCLFRESCLMEQGKRCAYFERAVLPTAADTGQTERIYAAYEKQCKVGLLARPQQRICPDCGTGLKPRERFCDNCKRKHRQKANRDNQQRIYTEQRGRAYTVK